MPSSQPYYDQQVAQYIPLVNRVARTLAFKLPSSVDVDDLIQVGLIGLLDAVDKYDPSKGAQFETYAVQRIRGAMLDELRSIDWAPRQVRKDMRLIEKAICELEQERGCRPSEQEIADKLMIPLLQFHQLLSDAKGHQLVYFEDFQLDDTDHFLDTHVTSTTPSVLTQLESTEFRQSLWEAITKLSDRDQLVLQLMYVEELNLKEIGTGLGVSESRVSQIHSGIIVTLRASLKDFLYPQNPIRVK